MIDDIDGKMEAALRRRFGDRAQTDAAEADAFIRQNLKRVTDRMLKTPGLIEVAELTAKGETEKAGQMLAEAFDAALNGELSQ
jgi:hypothetical protein